MVVVDVKSGNPLAIASHPTFDASTVIEDWKELTANEGDPETPQPLYNYALNGTYAPGSTFKPSPRWRRSARASSTPRRA